MIPPYIYARLESRRNLIRLLDKRGKPRKGVRIVKAKRHG